MRRRIGALLTVSIIACSGNSPSDPDGGVGDSLDAGDQGGSTDASAEDANTSGQQDGSAQLDASNDAGVGACSNCTPNQICLGEACSCINSVHGSHYLRTDGTVVHYNSAVADRTISIAGGLPLNNVTSMFSGSAHGCALRNDGSVWCWPTSSLGNAWGQLGNGSVEGSTPGESLYIATQVMVDAQTPLANVTRLNDGAHRGYLASATCGVLEDETLWCWGSPDSSGGGGGSLFNDGVVGNRPFAVQILAGLGTPLNGVKAVSLGSRHACVIRDDTTAGEVWCWAAGIGGSLGIGDEQGREFPTKVTLPAAASQVGAGADATCARLGDRVYCWGSSGTGQVGLGDPAMNSDGCINFCRLTPTEVLDGNGSALSGVEELQMAYLAACARRSDHSLWCWGRSTNTAQSVFAAPAEIDSAAVENVASFSTLGSSGYAETIVYLLRNNQLFRATQEVSIACAP